jgi:drug/metabolite transporter (DMT)-like permease
MIPLAVVLSQNVFGAFYSLLSRKLSVTMSHAQAHISAVLYLITLVFVVPFAFWYGPVSIGVLLTWWPYLLLGSVATALNGVSLLMIFRYMDAAMGSLLITTNVVAAVLSAMYILGERMGMHEVIGASMVIGAVIYALSVHVGRKERRNWTMGIVFTLCSAALFSVAVVTEKYLLGHMQVSSYLVWEWSLQTVCGLLLAFCFGMSQFRVVFSRQNLRLVLVAGAMRTGMGMLFVASLVVLKNLCTAVVLAGLRPLFVSLLGAALLRERRFLSRKIIASVAAAIGVAVMFF